jgi:hypothetical protein
MRRLHWVLVGLLASTVGVSTLQAQTQSPPRTIAAAEPGTEKGAYDRLPGGSRKIAEALFEAQHPRGDASRMTLDEVAAAKAGRDWGQVFRQMRSANLLDAETLGEVLSNRYALPPPPMTLMSDQPEIAPMVKVSLPSAADTEAPVAETTVEAKADPAVSAGPAAVVLATPDEASITSGVPDVERPVATGRPIVLMDSSGRNITLGRIPNSRPNMAASPSRAQTQIKSSP